MFIKNLNIVVIDDDAVIRNSLKILISNISKDSQLEVKLYSSSNGIDGLGLIYISNPELIIIDSTLPKYSGREIIDFLSSNQKYRNKSIIVLNDDVNSLKDLPPNYKIVSKSNKDFILELTKDVKEFFDKNHSGFVNTPESYRMKLVKGLVSRLIKSANSGDLLMHRIFNTDNRIVKTVLYIPWIFSQLTSSLLYTVLMLVYRQVKDANIEQGRKDLLMFRVRTYPTLITLLVGFIFLFLQLALFLTGGLVIFSSVKVESIFADYSREVLMDFTQTSFNPENIELVDGVLRFKPIVESTQIPIETPTQIEEPVTSPDLLQDGFPPSEDFQPSPSENTPPVAEEEVNTVLEDVVLERTNLENTPESSNGEEVLGASTESAQRITYPLSKEEVIFNTKISFATLIKINEVSNFNTREESVVDVNSTISKRMPKSNTELQNRILPSNGITYQLSPDKANWYYYSGGEGKWEMTLAGYASSNTIQEINQYLSDYVTQLGGNDLYIKAIFSSDGNTQVELRDLIVEREIYVVHSVNPSQEASEVVIDDTPSIVNISNLESFDASQPASFPNSYTVVGEGLIDQDTVEPTNLDNIYLPAPTIFQASSVNGRKLIYGKVLAEFNESDIANLKVRAFFTTNNDLNSNATQKGVLIGESLLSRNANGELTFLVDASAAPGGSVTVQLVLQSESKEILSPLSKPLQS